MKTKVTSLMDWYDDHVRWFDEPRRYDRQVVEQFLEIALAESEGDHLRVKKLITLFKAQFGWADEPAANGNSTALHR